MPVKKPSKFKRAATIGVASAGLALSALGVSPAEAKAHFREPENINWVKPAEPERVSDFVERGNEIEQREMFRNGLAKGKKAGLNAEEQNIERTHNKLMEKFKKGELSQKEINNLVNTLKNEGLPLANGPELKKMGLVGDIAEIPKYAWGLVVKGAKNVNSHYVLVGIAELITLFTYVQISRNARRRGLFKGIIENDRERARLGDFKELANWEKFGVLPVLGVYTANHYELGIILGCIASPYIRSQVVRLAQFLKNRGGGGSRPSDPYRITVSTADPTRQIPSSGSSNRMRELRNRLGK